MLIEPINGTTGGAFVPPDGYLRRVSEICRERNVLVIHDEVLTGLWRSGTPLASHHWDGCDPTSSSCPRALAPATSASARCWCRRRSRRCCVTRTQTRCPPWARWPPHGGGLPRGPG
ncbi:aminotransferase class III-fold pyridoxal phosphate-dependent enzyme [Streptomyces virginiae]|uniref:aminotransferase class III-fold pyridoxal phosphate-dependent enzyme n=1 Tax=Streptomyces virginiae TaxID=1961 RepID=UPI0036E9C6C5